MSQRENLVNKTTTPCPGCGGSGQTSYFAGESRFMLTWEDCPDCSGTGVLLPEGEDTTVKKQQRTDRLP